MPTSKYFNNFTFVPEQNLISDLIVETIKIYGYDFYYLPRRHGNLKEVINQDDMSVFDTYYIVEMYIKNVEGFAGEGQFLSKFGLEIRDRITLTIARSTFNKIVGGIEEISRPREGDLIYFPMTHKIWEVKQADPWVDFYPMGSLPMFDLQCDLFEYDNEHFNTGIEDIDNIEQNYSVNTNEFFELSVGGSPILDGNGMPIISPEFDIFNQDAAADNENIVPIIKPKIDYSIVDPFSRGQY